MRPETRTTIQIEANRLDLEIFNLANKIERFAAEWLRGSDGVNVASKANDVLAIRYHIRAHMHPKDREETI